MRPNLMMLSTDSTLKGYLRTEFAREGKLLNVDLSSIFAAKGFIERDKVNILILDVDTVVVLENSLKELMETYRVFIIIIGIKNATTAIAAGVKGTLSKPDNNNAFAQKILFRNLVDKINFHMRSYIPAQDSKVVMPTISTIDASDVNDKVIAIAASTGGTEALHTLLAALPARVPPILIVQHMPKLFTYQFAERLDQACKFSVKEASIKDVVKKNQALVAPGGLHMKIVRSGKKLTVECFNGNKVHGVIPAADVLFESMAEFMGRNVIGVVLTGMGADGARGLFKLKSKGATIIAQNKETSVIYGMPKAAADLGIVDHMLPLDKIAEKIMSLV